MRKSILILVCILLSIIPAVKAQESAEEKEKQHRAEERAAEVEKRQAQLEAHRAEMETHRAEMEAQKAFQEALHMKEMEEHLKSKHKELQKVMEQLQSKEIPIYNKVLQDLYGQWDNLKALEEENKELAQLSTEVKAIEIKLKLQEKEFKKLDDKNAKSKVKAELKGKLEKLFDLKVKKRQLEIDSLESEVDKLHDELNQIKRNKKQSIDMKLSQMTEGDVFSW
jgi:DNA repair exonuclease SbcCD ATPase subunit